MKHYLIYADIGDGIPSYDFVIKAKTSERACDIAWKILKQDYPETFSGKDWRTGDFSCREVDAKSLLKTMTLN